LFFYGFFKNKILRPVKNLSGQVFPFLLICIAALILGASIAISAGKSAITKTNVSNGADACSLAAGSIWASAFNNLVTLNKEMQDYYVSSLASYTYLYVLAEEYGDEAAYLTQLAKNKSDAALNKFYSGEDCTEWTQFEEGSKLDSSSEELNFDSSGELNTSEFEDKIDAARAAWIAAHFFNARSVLAFYMIRLTDNFKQSQFSNYCAARSSMDQAITQARSTGIQYAFSNSGTSSRAKDGDAFNSWLGSNQYEKNDSFNNPSSETNYNWQWQSKCGTSECGATVIVDMPKLTVYKLKHTFKNYPDEKTLNISSDILNLVDLDGETSVSEDPFNLQGYYGLAIIMLGIEETLAENAIEAHKIWQVTVQADYDPNNPTFGAARECCEATDPVCDAKTLYYDPLRTRASALREIQGDASAALEAVLNDGGLSVKTLMADDAVTFDHVWNTAASGLFEDGFFEGEGGEASSVLCNNYNQVTGDNFDQATFTSFIEDIPSIIYLGEDPVFEGPPEAWQTKCSVKSYCSNIYNERSDSCSGSSAMSTSTSEFQGEGVLKDLIDSYETQIIGTT